MMNARNYRTKEINKIVGSIKAYNALTQNIGDNRRTTNGYRSGAANQLNRILPASPVATFGGTGGSTTVG